MKYKYILINLKKLIIGGYILMKFFTYFYPKISDKNS